jgi:CYTH domain-containing protein
VNGREIERKYVIEGLSYQIAKNILSHSVYIKEQHDGTSSDVFWKQPNVDFIRLRENTNELTVKVTDKGTVEDRIEFNVPTTNHEEAYMFCTVAFGPPVGRLQKTFYVVDMGDDRYVSLYTVEGDDRVFLEIEAPSMVDVVDIEHDLRLEFSLVQQHRSLFDIFLGGL